MKKMAILQSTPCNQLGSYEEIQQDELLCGPPGYTREFGMDNLKERGKDIATDRINLARDWWTVHVLYVHIGQHFIHYEIRVKCVRVRTRH